MPKKRKPSVTRKRKKRVPGKRKKRLTWNRILLTVVIILGIVIVGLFVYNRLLESQHVSIIQEYILPYTILPEKPSLYGEIIKNPDFIYEGSGWFSYEDLPEGRSVLQRSEIDWQSNGYYHESAGNRNGVMVIHPVSKEKERYVQQTVFLPTGKEYQLVFGIANLEKYLDKTYNPELCYDNVFKILLIDKETGEGKIIFRERLTTNDGWKDFSIDISEFAGKEITIRLEGLAGGPCGDWFGEYGSVDYMDVISS